LKDGLDHADKSWLDQLDSEQGDFWHHHQNRRIDPPGDHLDADGILLSLECHGLTCELQNHLVFEALTADIAPGGILLENHSGAEEKPLYAFDIPRAECEQIVKFQLEELVSVLAVVID